MPSCHQSAHCRELGVATCYVAGDRSAVPVRCCEQICRREHPASQCHRQRRLAVSRRRYPRSVTLTPPSTGVLLEAWSSDMLFWRPNGRGSLSEARPRTGLAPRTPGSSMPSQQTTGSIQARYLSRKRSRRLQRACRWELGTATCYCGGATTGLLQGRSPLGRSRTGFAANARLDAIAAEDWHIHRVDVSVGDACAAINPVKANYRSCFDVVAINILAKALKYHAAA